MEYAYRDAGKLDTGIKKLIKEAVEEYDICRQNERSRSRPAVAIERASFFYAIITLDLKEFGKLYIL